MFQSDDNRLASSIIDKYVQSIERQARDYQHIGVVLYYGTSNCTRLHRR